MAHRPGTEVTRVGVYLEPALKVAAEKLAKKDRRSLSAFICVLIERAVTEAVARGELESVQAKRSVGGGDG